MEQEIDIPDLRAQLAAATTALTEAQARVTGLEERASKAENKFRHLAASINYHCKHEISTLQAALAAEVALAEQRRVALENLLKAIPEEVECEQCCEMTGVCAKDHVWADARAALSATPSAALAARDREVRVRCLREIRQWISRNHSFDDIANELRDRIEASRE